MNNFKKFHFLPLLLAFVWSCSDGQWKGQAPLERENTLTRPIVQQVKTSWEPLKGVFFSNRFDGARLNGIAASGENEVTVLITPENTPINSSPWYAFKVWSQTERKIKIRITYLQGVAHRYHPKISKDLQKWEPVPDSLYRVDPASSAKDQAPEFAEINLTVGPDTTWISAQELIVSKDIDEWALQIAANDFVQMFPIGTSVNGKKIQALQIGNPVSNKAVMILSRQHPPEVSGWLAMKAFTEQLCEMDSTIKAFRNDYVTYVVPCVNPDGVDLGHWRHNAGGVDLNRDWEVFNQPETHDIRLFMQEKVLKGKTFILAIDFHSTQEDIYYTMSQKLKGNSPRLIENLIRESTREFKNYKPNISPNKKDALRINSTVSIFNAFHAEAMTYEVGDETPRDFVQKKAETTAKTMVRLLMQENDIKK